MSGQLLAVLQVQILLLDFALKLSKISGKDPVKSHKIDISEFIWKINCTQ